MMESIEKLRKRSHLDDERWTLSDGRVMGTTNGEPNDPNAVNWGEQMREIADEIEREIAERYMLLPVDADGVPIRTGDIIEFGKKGERLEVTHIGWTKHGEPTIAYRRPNGTLDCSCIGTKCRHVKPRTLEDVLEEFAYKAVRIGMVGGVPCDAEIYASKDAIAKYAAEIRELMGVS